jgi:hypothetical protein
MATYISTVCSMEPGALPSLPEAHTAGGTESGDDTDGDGGDTAGAGGGGDGGGGTTITANSTNTSSSAGGAGGGGMACRRGVCDEPILA